MYSRIPGSGTTPWVHLPPPRAIRLPPVRPVAPVGLPPAVLQPTGTLVVAASLVALLLWTTRMTRIAQNRPESPFCAR